MRLTAGRGNSLQREKGGVGNEKKLGETEAEFQVGQGLSKLKLPPPNFC